MEDIKNKKLHKIHTDKKLYENMKKKFIEAFYHFQDFVMMD